jgi:hypothetical protein
MIKFSVFWTLICLAVPAALAQTHILKTDLIRPVRGLVSLAYERKINGLITWQFAIDRGTYQKETVYYHEDYKLKGFSFTPEFRIFPIYKRDEAPMGIFVGAAIRYAFLRERIYDSVYGAYRSNRGNILNYGIEAGYKFNANKLIIEVLGGFGGGQVMNFESMPNSLWIFHDIRKDEAKFYRLELAIGYMFK